jgi:hypothetical protein
MQFGGVQLEPRRKSDRDPFEGASPCSSYANTEALNATCGKLRLSSQLSIGHARLALK